MKIHRIGSALLPFALLMLPIAARAQASLSVSAGVNAPVGALGDIADLGYNIAAGISLGGTAVPVGLRFEGAYNGLDLRNTSGDVRILSGTANAIVNIGKTHDAPYIMAGLGAYNRQMSINNFGKSDTKTTVGIKRRRRTSLSPRGPEHICRSALSRHARQQHRRGQLPVHPDHIRDHVLDSPIRPPRQ